MSDNYSISPMCERCSTGFGKHTCDSTSVPAQDAQPQTELPRCTVCGSGLKDGACLSCGAKAASTAEEIARRWFAYDQDWGSLVVYRNRCVAAINEATAALQQRVAVLENEIYEWEECCKTTLRGQGIIQRAETAEAAIEQVRHTLERWHKEAVSHGTRKEIAALLALLPPAPQAVTAKEKP